MTSFAEGGGAYSAAYALASTADEIHCARTAGVGSIGVIATAVSYAGQLEKEGVAVAVVERDGAAASSALSEAQAKMAKGHIVTKKEAEAAAKAAAEAELEIERMADAVYSELPEWIQADSNRNIWGIITDEAKRRVMQAIKERNEP